MAKYTTQIKSVCESFSGLDFSDPLVTHRYDKVIAASRANIFNFNYPIFSESYRPVLETKILKHFYFREIAFETFGQFKLYLDDKLNIIMPYYNKLYESEQFDFDPFLDTDYEITHDEDTTRVGNFNGTDNITHDGSTSSVKDTDNTDTLVYNDSVINTHNDDVDKYHHGTLEKGTNKTTTNTGNQMNNVNLKNKVSDKDVEELSHGHKVNNDMTYWKLHSDTPQGQIDNIERTGYYTDIEKNTEKGTVQENTGKDITTTTYGKQTDDTGYTNRVDNLKELEKNTGKDTDEFYETGGTVGGYTNTGSKNSTDTLKGKITDTGTNDFTEDRVHKSDDDIKTTDDYIRKIKGKVGTKSYSEMLEEYRRTLLNIDEMILDELEELFFQLW